MSRSKASAVLKFVFIGMTALGLAGAGVLLHPKPRETFAFATADGRGLMIYACLPHESPGVAETNALAAHRFLQAELQVTAEPQVQAMVAELDLSGTGPSTPGLAATLAEAETLREEILRNLSSTHGCDMVRTQTAQS